MTSILAYVTKGPVWQERYGLLCLLPGELASEQPLNKNIIFIKSFQRDCKKKNAKDLLFFDSYNKLRK